MEPVEEDNVNFETKTEAAGRSSIFAELKHCCVEILDLHQNPKKDASALFQLLQLLRHSSSDALQPFFDYTLFPLLLLLDAAVGCRSSVKADSEVRPRLSTTFSGSPCKVSDITAEHVLYCLEELLNKCYLGSVDQMVVMLKKLTHAALLSPSEAPEEFREGVIRCFRALLLNLDFCSNKFCSCKDITGCPVLLAGNDLQFSFISKDVLKAEECLLAFFQSETASAAVGHWLSLLLKAADIEASRGLRGNATLRTEAFKALRMLVAKVGTADALAFFLPGVISQIGKILHMSKTIISGAAGSSEALDHAIRCLAEILMVVLADSANLTNLELSLDGTHGTRFDTETLASCLEELRNLSFGTHHRGSTGVKDVPEAAERGSPVSGFNFTEKGDVTSEKIGSLRVKRTKDWIMNTAFHVDKLLSATFPHLCVHPSKKFRKGLVEAIGGLLSKCSYTLKQSRLVLLESLCVLACDDSEEVSSTAHMFLGDVFASNEKDHLKNDVSEIFRRLVDKLPTLALRSEEAFALSTAQKLFVVVYFSGPKLVADYLLQSSVSAARFLDGFALSLSQNSVFAGALDKKIITKPVSAGHVRSIAELKAIDPNSKLLGYSQSRKMTIPADNVPNEYELPRIPPWFIYVGNQKLYQALAGVLRLVGLSLFADAANEGSLSIIIDIPLGNLRKLVSEIRLKEYRKESWQSWWDRTNSGQLVRQASTAACILNEMIFGLSDRAVDSFTRMFPKSSLECHSTRFEEATPKENIWKICQSKGARSHLIDSIGSIMHEYLSPELWSLPSEHTILQQSGSGAGDINLHFFHDNAMLHQVVIEGIGIFNICLGKDFSSSGFLHSSLYTLLRNLICSGFQIRSTSDAVLHVISALHDYPTVGHLVLANSDYVIDSICQQLRHLDLNPYTPSVLAALLSYTGIAHKILPLLEEPMRTISMELEVIGRNKHPDLTLPFLKAVAEVSMASNLEACLLPDQAESYNKFVKSQISVIERELKRLYPASDACVTDGKDDSTECGPGINSDCKDSQLEQWESILIKLNDSRRYRQTVGSISSSCLIAVTPLLASTELEACLLALDIVQDGILALAKVEEAYKHEKETKEAIEWVFRSLSFHDLQDNLHGADNENAENRLLPAVNKIWPFLVACVQNKNPVAVQKCTCITSHIVQICGGDFFSRRFYTDGTHFWRLLSTSPFRKKPISTGVQTPLQLPYRSVSASSEDSVAEVSEIKAQVAVLNMIAVLAQNKRSSSALEAVLKRVSGLVVGIACSGVMNLRDASINALAGLASMDPDLLWLLLADVYFSKKEGPPRPTTEFSELSQILPPPSSTKEYLYVRYGGQSYGFGIDFPSVEIVFKALHSLVFTQQLYY